MELKFIKTCNACPEQYDVVDEENKCIAYVRLRWGRLTAETEVIGELIYWHDFKEGFKGEFTILEREKYLKIIEKEILKYLKSSKSPNTKFL